MTFPLTSLPPEIVTTILTFLDADDVLSLGKCMELIIDRQVYDHCFHDHTVFSHYNLETFRQRSNARLYLIGGEGNHKEDAYHEFTVRKVRFRMHTPRRVEGGGIISECSLGGYAIMSRGNMQYWKPCVTKEEPDRPVFQFQTAEGRVKELHDDFDSERSHKKWQQLKKQSDEAIAEYEEWADYSEIPGESPSASLLEYGEGLYEDVPKHLPTVPPEVLQYSERLYGEQYVASRFVQVACAPSTIALDDHGMVWFWAESASYHYQHPTQGVPLLLTKQNTHSVIPNRVLQVAASNNVYCCLFEGLGVGILDLEDNSVSSKTIVPNGSRAGYHCFDTHFCHCDVKVVPQTADAVFFAVVKCGADCGAVFLNREGFVGAVNFESDERVGGLQSLNAAGPFRQLSAGGEHIGLVTTAGNVVTVVLEQREDRWSVRPHLVQGLPKVASLAANINHFVVLSDTGEVWRWGKEPYFLFGQLGLGRIKDAVKKPGVTVEQLDDGGEALVLEKPAKMDILPGKACAVFASGWCTGVLMCRECE